MGKGNIHRGGRRPTGYTFFEGGRWKARVRTCRGATPVLSLDPRFTADEEDRAKAQGAEFATQIRESGWEPEDAALDVSFAVGEALTVSKWFEKWHVSREKGKATETHRKEVSHYTKWIEPTLGHL
jgi:hypothetical protein